MRPVPQDRRRALVDHLTLTGHLSVLVENLETGERWTLEQRNLVVTAGKNLLRDFLANDAPTGLTHIALGTDATTPAANDTALGTEVYRAVITSTTKNSEELVVRLYVGTGAANGNTLTEAGLFNDPSAGTMLARALLSTSIVKTSSIAATFTWTLSL